MIEVEAPDGTIVEFPDGTPRDVMRQAMQKRFAPQPESNFSQLDSGVLGAAQGATLGFGDELAGIIGAVVDGFGGPEGFIEAYQRHAGDARAMLKEAEGANPKTFLGGEIAGGIAPSLVPGGAAMRGANLLEKTGRGILGGAGIGAVAGAGAGEGIEDTVNRAAKGALTGAALGGVAPSVGTGVGKVVQKVKQARLENQAAKKFTSTDVLRNETNKLYKKLREAGIEYSPKAYGSLVQQIERDLAKNFKPSLADKAYKFLDDLKADIGKSPDFDDLNALSIQLGKAARKSDDANGPALLSIKEKINAFEKSAPLRSTSGLNQAQINKFRSQARDVSFRKIKSEIVDEAIEKSGFYKSGDESGLSNQFLNLLKNPKKRKMFSKTEQKAFRNVGKGTVGRNVLDIIGKFGLDPSKGGSTRSMLGIGSGATGANAALMGEPVTATIGLGLAGAGTLARPLARRGTRKAAERAAGLVRAGDKTVQQIQSNAARKSGLESAAIAGQFSGNNAFQSRQPVTIGVRPPTNISELEKLLLGRQ